jgi:hypothetical protein
LVLTLASMPAVAAPPQPASPRATFGIGPANARGLDSRAYLRYYASPGASATDHVAVRNLGATPLKINVYVTNAEAGSDGSVGFAQRTAKPTGDATWLAVKVPGGESAVVVNARSLLVLPVKLKVPSNASPGDHTVAIIASIVSKIKGRTGQLIDFEQRVALRSFIRISGPLDPNLVIKDVTARIDAQNMFPGRGRVTVSYLVVNDGNINLAGRPSVQIRGSLGVTGIPPHQADIPILLPGASVRVNVTVPKVLAAAWMRAKVTIVPLKPAEDSDPPLVPITAEARFFAVPSVLILVLVGLVLLSIPLCIWWRRRTASGPKTQRRSDGTVTPADTKLLHVSDPAIPEEVAP